jgi:hypothetical protein
MSRFTSQVGRLASLHIQELNNYADVFHNRIANAFDDLIAEADQIEKEEYSRLSTISGDDCSDDSEACEQAYFKGVDFYIATDAVRQGIINLMVAGLFHLFEQQAGVLARELDRKCELSSSKYPWKKLKDVLRQMKVDVSLFKSHPLLDEVRLAANVIKHGDGDSSSELRSINPSLFKEIELPSIVFHMPLRPLVGEGLLLSAANFKTYHAGLEAFYQELLESFAELSRDPS